MYILCLFVFLFTNYFVDLHLPLHFNTQYKNSYIKNISNKPIHTRSNVKHTNR